jgi:hypothetical protein
MSNTRVLTMSSPDVSAWLVHGAVIAREPHPRGAVLSLPPGEIAFYCVHAVRCRTFVFRTLATLEPGSSELVGVRPSVRLLLQTQSRGRLKRLEALLRYLARAGRQPSTLSDTFYLRLHAILSGKLPSTGKVLTSLLEHEHAPL